MSVLGAATQLARLAVRMPGYLRGRDSLAEGRALLAQRLADREHSFLRLAERSIYGHPRSPYLRLLRAAGCELGDLRRLVSTNGLEAALLKLRRAGVYVRFEESKGREPVTRGSLRFSVRPEDFDNPRSRKHLESRSSGSTGSRTINPIDLDHLAALSPVNMVVRHQQGLLDPPWASVRGRLPESPTFGGALESARHGRRIERWYHAALDPPRKQELRFRVAHLYVLTVSRLCGVHIPPPRPLRMSEAAELARWAQRAAKRAGSCVVSATPSLALRVCVAALDEGIDLTGTVFRVTGEPMTEAKLEAILAVGARAVVDYVMTGLSWIGAGCLRARSANEQHFRADHLAAITSPRHIGDREVGSLHLSTFLPTAPRIWINLETDDYCELVATPCGCPLGPLGLTTRMLGLRSFSKLTAEGVTLVAGEIERLIERDLPRLFGGSALDFQLVEEEGPDGITRISLDVSPRLGEIDEHSLTATVLDGLGRASIAADLAARLWTQAGSFRIRRREPAVVGRGKLLPLRRETALERSA